MPLDTYVFAPVILMDLVNMDKNKGRAVSYTISIRFCCDLYDEVSEHLYNEVSDAAGS